MTTSSNDITIRQIGQEELDRFQQRIVQIFLDAFTTNGFAFNAQRATEAKAVSSFQLLLAQDSVAFFAFDAGKVRILTTQSASYSAAPSRLTRS
jgi:hypothetical protein